MKDTFSLNITTADHLGIGLFKYSFYPRDKFLITNSTLSDMLGYPSKRELKKLSLRDLFQDGSQANAFINGLRIQGKTRFFQARFKCSDGKLLWVAITASVVKAGDKSEHIEGIIENITTHKAMEEELEIERDLLRGVLDNLPDAIYFKDKENRIIKVNKYYAQGMGLTPEEIIGKTDFDFFPYDQAHKMFEDDKSVLKSGEPIVGKIERTLLPNGTWNQVITTKIPLYNISGDIIGTMGITRDMTAYANLEHERLEMVINALKVLGKTLELRDPYTFSHMRRVADIAERIGRTLGWDKDRLLGIRLAGELHDMGKITIPLDILNKPGRLSDLEYRLIQEHVEKCYSIVKDVQFPFPLAQTIGQHHERLDGTGYPRRLKGNEILMEARILAVSDVLEAMTHHRPYREALGVDQACHELQKGCGLIYDPQVVDTVLGLISDNDGNPFWLNQ